MANFKTRYLFRQITIGFLLTCPLLEGPVEDPVIRQDPVHVTNGRRGPDDQEAGGRQRGALNMPRRGARN